MKSKFNLTKVFLFAAAMMSLALAANATVALGPLFGTNMVLQRGKAIPVSGTASANKTITVTFNGQTKTTISDSTGAWQLFLDSMVAKATGGNFMAAEAGANTVTLTNVVVGDVWICSGQSNMDMVLGSCNRQVDIDSANYPAIRRFGAPLVTSEVPLKTVSGSWTVCSPSTASGFSGVAFYFARKICQDQSSAIPIGLYHASVGGTCIDPWLAPEGATDIPVLAPLYTQNIMPNGPFSLFNGMVYPYAPLPAKGMIWYQGENAQITTQSADSYYLKMKALAQGYKRMLGQDDFAFYFVQLAYWGTLPTNATPVLTSGGWDADTRIQQANAMAIPHSGMASAMDVGSSLMGDQIWDGWHPKDKYDVGERLALWALKNEYGRSIPTTSGPVLRDVNVSGSTLICSFDNIGNGLMVGAKAEYLPTAEVAGGTLQKFSISGASGTWYAGNATIVDNTVVVSHPSVPTPRRIAYACWQNPVGANLYNKVTLDGVANGLPASPFYVDDVLAKYTITATPGTNGSITPGTSTYLKRATALYTITPNAGYYITDVKVDGVSVGAVKYYTFDPLYANHTITATFGTTAPSFTVTASSNSGGSLSPSGAVSIAQGGSQTFNVLPSAGCKVASLLVDGKSICPRSSFTFGDVRINHTISAAFATSITASASYGGTISPSGPVTVNHGSNQTFTITPNSGYTISAVMVDGVNVGTSSSYTFNNVTTTHTISASFSGGAGGVGSVPQQSNIIFSAQASTFPASGNTGNWATLYPAGKTLTTIGSPTVEMIGGRKWERNIYPDYDGYRFGSIYTSAIPCNGATIVVAAKPIRSSNSGSWSSIVDVFYDRLVLGIKNDTGQVNVRRNGSADFSTTTIPDGQITILSLVAQSTGTYKVYANGVQIYSNTTASALTSLNPLWNGGGTGFWSYINVGRNEPDGWTTFNGNIGDVFLYKTALTDVERGQLEQYIANKLTDYTITATAGTGGTISPSGTMTVMSGANQAFTIAPSSGYVIADVKVDGVSQGAIASYTFSSVIAGHTIAATFAAITPVANIAALKSKVDGTLVSLTGPSTVIYAPKSSGGTRTTTFFYIGEAQGRGGLKVTKTAVDTLTLGNQVSNLTGYVRKPAGKEAYLELIGTATGSGSSLIKPIAMNNKSALIDTKAQTNAVKVWGKVKSINGATSFVIADGYNASGITVMVNGVALPAVFDTTKTVTVNGILTKNDAGALIVNAQDVK